MVWQEYKTVDKLVEKLNEQEQVIVHWCKSSQKITKLLEENTKPTTNVRFEDVYLDIDNETKRCKYEQTFICNKCAFYSKYFLDCRLMMEDRQYKKALELGLIEELKGD